MKTTILALAMTAAVLSTPVSAGSLSDPVVEPEIVIEDTVATSSNVQGLLAFIAAATIIVAGSL